MKTDIVKPIAFPRIIVARRFPLLKAVDLIIAEVESVESMTLYTSPYRQSFTLLDSLYVDAGLPQLTEKVQKADAARTKQWRNAVVALQVEMDNGDPSTLEPATEIYYALSQLTITTFVRASRPERTKCIEEALNTANLLDASIQSHALFKKWVTPLVGLQNDFLTATMAYEAKLADTQSKKRNDVMSETFIHLQRMIDALQSSFNFNNDKEVKAALLKINNLFTDEREYYRTRATLVAKQKQEKAEIEAKKQEELNKEMLYISAAQRQRKLDEAVAYIKETNPDLLK